MGPGECPVPKPLPDGRGSETAASSRKVLLSRSVEDTAKDQRKCPGRTERVFITFGGPPRPIWTSGRGSETAVSSRKVLLSRDQS